MMVVMKLEMLIRLRWSLPWYHRGVTGDNEDGGGYETNEVMVKQIMRIF